MDEFNEFFNEIDFNRNYKIEYNEFCEVFFKLTLFKNNGQNYNDTHMSKMWQVLGSKDILVNIANQGPIDIPTTKTLDRLENVDNNKDKKFAYLKTQNSSNAEDDEEETEDVLLVQMQDGSLVDLNAASSGRSFGTATAELKYIIVHSEGAKIRSAIEVNSNVVSKCPRNTGQQLTTHRNGFFAIPCSFVLFLKKNCFTVIEISERVYWEKAQIFRLKIVSPIIYSGWVSEMKEILIPFKSTAASSDSEKKKFIDSRTPKSGFFSCFGNRKSLEEAAGALFNNIQSIKQIASGLYGNEQGPHGYYCLCGCRYVDHDGKVVVHDT